MSTGKWLTSEDAWRILTGGPGDLIRIGPLASYSFSPHFPEGLQHKLSLTMKAQVETLHLPINVFIHLIVSKIFSTFIY